MTGPPRLDYWNEGLKCQWLSRTWTHFQTADCFEFFEVNLKFYSWSIHPTQTYWHLGSEHHIRLKLHSVLWCPSPNLRNILLHWSPDLFLVRTIILLLDGQAQHIFCQGVWVKSILCQSDIVEGLKICQSLIFTFSMKNTNTVKFSSKSNNNELGCTRSQLIGRTWLQSSVNFCKRWLWNQSWPES